MPSEPNIRNETNIRIALTVGRTLSDYTMNDTFRSPQLPSVVLPIRD